jgi:hypothetical protein
MRLFWEAERFKIAGRTIILRMRDMSGFYYIGIVIAIGIVF